MQMRYNLNKNTKFIFEAIFVIIRLGDKLCTILRRGFSRANAIADDEEDAVVDRYKGRIDAGRNA